MATIDTPEELLERLLALNSDLSHVRLLSRGVDMRAGGEAAAKRLADAARAICCQAAQLAMQADLAEGVRPRWANGLVKRVRKALGDSYP